jgi:hypothetical protein
MVGAPRRASIHEVKPKDVTILGLGWAEHGKQPSLLPLTVTPWGPFIVLRYFRLVD